MLKTVWLNLKRRILLMLFKGFDIKYHAKHLGKAMADADNEFDRKYHHEKLREAIQRICEKRSITPDDLRLIEDDLNDYLNGLVNRAHGDASQRQKVRKFVDNRIKIKRVERHGLNDRSPESKPEPEL